MKKIVLGLYMPDEICESYRDRFDLDVPTYQEKQFTRDQILAKLRSAQGYVGGFLDREMIDAAGALEVASTFGAGFDAFDIEYAGLKGIPVMNAPHGTTEPTAELTIAILLCLTRRIFNFNRRLMQRRDTGGLPPFFEAFDDAPVATPAHGKTLGIIGFGKIGRSVAKKAVGLGMKVIYNDVVRAPAEVESQLGAVYRSFEEVLRESDYVTLHCMYNEGNHHMMDRDQFSLMKPTAYFINAARGGLMNEQALLDALDSRGIQGAALDVFEFEPAVSERMLLRDDVVLTPHIGTSTLESRHEMAAEALAGITEYLSGGSVSTIVNKEFLR